MNVHGVRFNGNGSTEGTMDDQAFAGEKALHPNTFKKEGYTFKEWNTEKDGTGNRYTDRQPITLTSDITLFAVWAPEDRLVTFDPSGGSGSMEKQIFKYNVPQDLSANKFVKTGYTFAGWSKTEGGSKDYDDKQSITLTSDITLYAVWTPNDYKVTFDSNGGSGTMGDQTFTFGVAKNLSKNLFTRDGYKFAGWNTEANGSGISYADEASYTIGLGNATLYAQWTPNDYKVTFDSNDGSGSTSDQTFTFGVAKNLSKNMFTRDGYKFAGWNTKADGKEISYADEASYTIGAGNATLYAVWEPMDRLVTFDSNGGTGNMEKQIFKYNISQDLSANKFVRTGYTFAGWSATPGGSVVYIDEENITLTSDITLYAVWTPNKHTLSFEPNGGAVTPTSKDVTYDSAIGQLPVPTKDGCTFMGWYIGDIRIDENYVWKFTTGQIAKAVWGHSFTPSSGKGGSISPDGKVIVADGTDKTFTITADKGFKIKDVTVDGVSVGAVSTYTFSNVTGNHTIYAEFERASPEPGPVNPTNPDSPNGLYLGFIAVFAVLLASLVAVLFKLRK